MGRESSHGIKELLNLSPTVLKARHLGGSAFCWDIGLPEQAMGWLYPLGLGLVAEDKPTEFSCTCTCTCKGVDRWGLGHDRDSQALIQSRLITCLKMH